MVVVVVEWSWKCAAWVRREWLVGGGAVGQGRGLRSASVQPDLTRRLLREPRAASSSLPPRPLTPLRRQVNSSSCSFPASTPNHREESLGSSSSSASVSVAGSGCRKQNQLPRQARAQRRAALPTAHSRGYAGYAGALRGFFICPTSFLSVSSSSSFICFRDADRAAGYGRGDARGATKPLHEESIAAFQVTRDALPVDPSKHRGVLRPCAAPAAMFLLPHDVRFPSCLYSSSPLRSSSRDVLAQRKPCNF